MTASQLRSDLNAATGVLVSTDTIRRRLQKKGLYARRPIICVPLTPPKKRARKLWCGQHVAWNPDEWRRAMFTDESRFSLNSDSRRVFVWREVGTKINPQNMVERDPYRSQGIMVWAGIFLGGRTALNIFQQGTLTGQRYRDEILAAYVMPQALEMGENFLLMDDNARPHRAGVVDTFLQNHSIARMNWPARSPDLNPIEHVWDNLGRRISSLQSPPRNNHELETALTQEVNLESPFQLELGFSTRWWNLPSFTERQHGDVVLSPAKALGSLVMVWFSSSGAADGSILVEEGSGRDGNWLVLGAGTGGSGVVVSCGWTGMFASGE
ncbi:hypothetical protein LAZ67_9002323, partial [Cordylochernes scorpioides]